MPRKSGARKKEKWNFLSLLHCVERNPIDFNGIFFTNTGFLTDVKIIRALTEKGIAVTLRAFWNSVHITRLSGILKVDTGTHPHFRLMTSVSEIIGNNSPADSEVKRTEGSAWGGIRIKELIFPAALVVFIADSQSDAAGELSIPDGWNIKPTSRTTNLTHGMIEYTASGSLRLQSTQILALYQSENSYPGAKQYQFFAKVRAPKATYFFIDASQKSGTGFKQIQRVISRTLAPGDHEIHGFLDLSSFPGEWVFEFGIVNGELEIETLSLVDEKVFRDSAPSNNH